MTCQWIPGNATPACDWDEGCPHHGSGRPDAQTILRTPMPDGNDANAGTVGDYLITLLANLWRDEADFDGKRPFGNSGWQYDIAGALIAAGHVPGRFDECGSIDEVDDETFQRIVAVAIESLRLHCRG